MFDFNARVQKTFYEMIMHFVRVKNLNLRLLERRAKHAIKIFIAINVSRISQLATIRNQIDFIVIVYFN